MLDTAIMKKAAYLFTLVALSACDSSDRNSRAVSPDAKKVVNTALACHNIVKPNGLTAPLSEIIDGVSGIYQMQSAEIYAELQFVNGKRVGFVLSSTLGDRWNDAFTGNTAAPVLASQNYSCMDFNQIHGGHFKTTEELPAVIDRATGKTSIDLKFSAQHYKCTLYSCGTEFMGAERLPNEYADLASFVTTPRPGHDFSAQLQKIDATTFQIYLTDNYLNDKGEKIRKQIQAVYRLR